MYDHMLSIYILIISESFKLKRLLSMYVFERDRTFDHTRYNIFFPSHVQNEILYNILSRKFELMANIFTCVAEGESRSRSALTPSVCPSVRSSVCPSVRPKILSSQLLWNYWSNYHENWYVDRTSYVVMHIGRKFLWELCPSELRKYS